MKQKAGITLLVTLCFFLTLFVFGPANLFVINQTEFLITFKEVLLYTVPLALFFTIFLGVILLFLKLSFHKKIISLLLALSFLLWFQGNIIVWQYGPLDGRTIHWNTYWVYGAIDTSIWFLVVALAIMRSAFLYRFSRAIANFLILIQLLSVAITSTQIPSDSFNFRFYVHDETPKFNFSRGKNVILLILDEFQSNIFQEIITQDDSYKNIFDGFVYFRNALAAFSFTELAVPAILTGEFYDNSVKRGVFLKNVFLGKSIPKVLKEKGFIVNLFPLEEWSYRSMYFDERICSNLKKRQVSIGVQLREVLRLFDLALFRHLPHLTKKYIYNNNRWLLSRSLPTYYRSLKGHFNVFKMYKDERSVGTELPSEEFEGKKFTDSAKLKTQLQTKNNVFQFYHLNGMHVPLNVNERSEIVHQMAYNKKNYTGQAKACLRTCEMFFDILKQKGAYDNSLIFVIGDHGSGRTEDMYINPVYDSHNAVLDQTSAGDTFQYDKARGIPLVLVKPFNSRGELKISDAPVSLIDIPRTITSELEIKADFPGVSMFEVNDDYNRKRYYGAFKWDIKETDFIEPITMYVVTGFSWSDESWEVQSILPPPPKTPSKFFGRKKGS